MSFFKDLDKNESADDGGLLSQDAIEALFASMNSEPVKEEPKPTEPAPAAAAADDGGVMSQDAIAALFASMNSEPAKEEPAPAVAAADDGGVMSQDAIAALFASMNSEPAKEEPKPAEPSKDEALFAENLAEESAAAIDNEPLSDDGLFEFEDEPVANASELPGYDAQEEISETNEADKQYNVFSSAAAEANQAASYDAVEENGPEIYSDNLVDAEDEAKDSDFEINNESVSHQDRSGYRESSDSCAVITKGTIINGSIISDSSLNVIGTVNGDIECIGKLTITGNVTGNSVARDVFVNAKRLEGNIDSEGTVKISLGTVVVGNIVAKSAVIAGAIKGDVDVKGPVILDSTAIIMGNVKAKSVQVNNGAVLQGFCSLEYSELDLSNIFE